MLAWRRMGIFTLEIVPWLGQKKPAISQEAV
jgi:hypothetical protein